MDYTATYSPEDNKLRLYASARLDKETYQRVKDAGFRWAPKQELFVAPMWTPQREDLLIELAGEIEDEDKSLVERQEERAERFEDYSDNRAKDADRAHAAVHAIADHIPLGQPILVGHHSERHARRDAKKIENGMRKAVKMWQQSKYWTDRAAGALRHAKYKERPDVRARRIKTIEAEIRSYRARFTPSSKQVIMQRKWSAPDDAAKVPHIFCAPRGGRGGSWVPVDALPGLEAYYTRWIQHAENRLAYEKAMLNEQGAADLLKPKPRSAAASLPLCNYRAPGGIEVENIWKRGQTIVFPQVEMTAAEYAKVYADYKGTRVAANSHRVRTAVIRQEHVCVFITDAKTHTPPAAISPEPVTEPRRWPVPQTQPENPNDEKFEQLKDALKAGVKAVSAPQLFPTPPDLARRMCDEAGLLSGQTVLEPSAGTGNILRAIWNNATGADCVKITAVEINYNLSKMLEQARLKQLYANEQNFRIVNDDFLECTPEQLGTFSRILMNPPFENGSDIKHVQHALTFLKPGGRLVAICAGGPRQQEQLKPLTEEAGSWEPLPAGTFASSGTGVNTVLLVIDKEEQQIEEEIEEGQSILADSGETAPAMFDEPAAPQLELIPQPRQRGLF